MYYAVEKSGVMKRTLTAIALVLALSLYALVKLFALRPVIGDENIYFYQAWRMTDGLMPYRDFVSAHPPLHLYVLAAVAALTKGEFIALKAVPMLFTLGTGLCVFALCRAGRFRPMLPGTGWCILAMAVFLLSFDTLRISSRATGTNQATFFLTLGFLFQVRGLFTLAGVCYGASVATALFVAPVLVCLLAFGWADMALGTRRTGMFRLLAGLALSLVAIHLPSWLIAPGAWWDQTVLFHFKKPPIGPDFVYTFTRFLAAEGTQTVACALGAVWFLLDRVQRRYVWLMAAALSVLPFGLALKRVYIYYWFPAFPFLAIGTCIFLHKCWQMMRVKPALAVGLAMLCIGSQPVWYVVLARSLPAMQDSQEQIFHPTPVVRVVNPIVRAILSLRTLNWVPMPGLVRALRHENRQWWDVAPAVTALQQTLAQNETLYGDSTTTPLLALLSRRRIAGELADTNTMQFRTGRRSVGGDIQKAFADGVRVFVAQPNRGIYLLPEYREFLTKIGPPWRVETTGLGPVLLFLVQRPNTT